MLCGFTKRKSGIRAIQTAKKMRLRYQFRDKDNNLSWCSTHAVETRTPNDFATLQAFGVAFSAVSNAQLIAAAIEYTSDDISGLPVEPSSHVDRVLLACCILETNNMYLVAIPSCRLALLAVVNGSTVPVVLPTHPAIVELASRLSSTTDEYGTPFSSIAIAGLAL